MRNIKEVAQEMKEVIELHDKAYRANQDFIWKGCNDQLEALGTEACMALATDPKYFWKLFPRGNTSILEYLNETPE